jgi:SAM-dependent methyltransferase
MGIVNLHIEKIDHLIKNYFTSQSEKQVAIIGFPDMVQNLTVLEKIFDKESLDKSYHNGIYYLIDILKNQHNCHSTVFDIKKVRGIEEFLNLNLPLPDSFKGKFDFVIDSSCLEHCFNVPQAFRNLCDLVRIGGIVTTIAPISLFNHGYYNINPIFYEDGFLTNGFNLLSQTIVDNNGDIIIGFSSKTMARKCFILTTAIKIEEKEFTFPIQSHKGKDRIYDKR